MTLTLEVQGAAVLSWSVVSSPYSEYKDPSHVIDTHQMFWLHSRQVLKQTVQRHNTMLQPVAFARAGSSTAAAAAAAFGMPSVHNSSFRTATAGQSPCSFMLGPIEQQQCTQQQQQQQFSSRAGSDESYTPTFSSTTSPEAVTSKGEPGINSSRSSSESGHTTFTGTADVFTPSSDSASQQQPTVATDSNRSWMSGDDLGTRVEAATSDNATTAATHNQQQQQGSGADRQQGEGATLGVDAAAPECHPADPYC
jgi:hypothetical protein